MTTGSIAVAYKTLSGTSHSYSRFMKDVLPDESGEPKFYDPVLETASKEYKKIQSEEERADFLKKKGKELHQVYEVRAGTLRSKS